MGRSIPASQFSQFAVLICGRDSEARLWIWFQSAPIHLRSLIVQGSTELVKSWVTSFPRCPTSPIADFPSFPRCPAGPIAKPSIWGGRDHDNRPHESPSHFQASWTGLAAKNHPNIDETPDQLPLAAPMASLLYSGDWSDRSLT